MTVGTKNSGRLTLGDMAAVEERERVHRAAEAARVLYVAATRARDHLIVSLHHQATRAGKGGASRLIGAGALEHAARWEPPSASRTTPVAPLSDLEVAGEPTSAAEHAEARRALAQRARTVRYTSATGIASSAGPHPAERGEEGGDEPWARGRGGTRVGRAVHAAIQSLPLDAGPAQVAAAAAAQAVAEAVPERADEVAGLVAAALDSQAAARARSSVGALREVPFAFRHEEAIVEGFIDLVIPTARGVEIVDWKTDDVPRAGVDERLAGYRVQAGLYARGLGEATGLEVERITYVFVRAGLERSPGEPGELVALALAAV